MRRLQRRDPDAQEELARRFFPNVYGFVRRLVADDELAADLTQDVFVGVRRSLEQLDPARSLLPWLLGIARNKVSDHWRSPRLRLARSSVSIEREGSSLELPASPGEPAGDCVREETAALVREAVWRLSDPLRSVVVLRVYEGFSFDAIARMLRLCPPAARKRYSRALASLRRTLGRVA